MNTGNPAVGLRDVTRDDLGIFFEHQQDSEAAVLAAFPTRERETFFDDWERLLGDPAVIARTITCDGEVAGNIVSPVHDGERVVAYWLGRDFWGRGVASRALSAFVEAVPERPIFAHVAEHNSGSVRVLEKCGFQRLGVLPTGDAEPYNAVTWLRLRLDS